MIGTYSKIVVKRENSGVCIAVYGTDRAINSFIRRIPEGDVVYKGKTEIDIPVEPGRKNPFILAYSRPIEL